MLFISEQIKKYIYKLHTYFDLSGCGSERVDFLIKKQLKSRGILFVLVLFFSFMLGVNLSSAFIDGSDGGFSKVSAFSVRADDDGDCSGGSSTSAKPHTSLPVSRVDCTWTNQDVPPTIGCYAFANEKDGGAYGDDDCAYGILPENQQIPIGGTNCKKTLAGNDPSEVGNWLSINGQANAKCVLNAWKHSIKSDIYPNYLATSQICGEDGYWYRCDSNYDGYGIISNDVQFTCTPTTGSERLCTGYSTFYQWEETDKCEDLVSGGWCTSDYGDGTANTMYPAGTQGCKDLYGQDTDMRCVKAGICGDDVCNTGEEWASCPSDCVLDYSWRKVGVTSTTDQGYPGFYTVISDTSTCGDPTDCVYNGVCKHQGEQLTVDGKSVCIGEQISILSESVFYTGSTGESYGSILSNGDDNLHLFQSFSSWLYYKRSLNNGNDFGSDTSMFSGSTTRPRHSEYVDGNNIYVVAHISPSGGTAGLYYTKSTDNGETWNAPSILFSLSTRAYSSITAKGNNIFILYYHNGHLRARTSTNGGNTWSSSTISSQHGGMINKRFSSVMDSDGNVHVVYRASDNSLKYARYSGTWMIIPIDNTVGISGQGTVSIGVDSIGGIHIIYYDNSNHDLRYVKSTDEGVTWTDTLLVSAGDSGKYNSLFIDDNDNIHIGYTYFNTWRKMKYMKLTREGIIITNEYVTQNNEDHGKSNSVTADSYGNAHLIYSRESFGDPIEIYWARISFE